MKSNKSFHFPTLFIFFISLFILSGCDVSVSSGKTKYKNGEVKGSGNIKTEIYEIHEFKGIIIDHVFDVNIASGNGTKVIITADDNIASLFVPKISDGDLMIHFSKGFKSKNPVKIRIETPDIEKIIHQGSGKIIIDNLDLKFLEISSSGAGKITGLGQVEKLWIESSGAGDIMLQDFQSDECEVLLTGVGTVTVYTQNHLEAVNRGAGEIIYFGNPDTKEIQNNGAGEITRK